MSDQVYVVFDGPPSHESGRFIEVENEKGEGVSIDGWKDRGDGYWTLGPFVRADLMAELRGLAEAVCDAPELTLGKSDALRALDAWLAAHEDTK